MAMVARGLPGGWRRSNGRLAEGCPKAGAGLPEGCRGFSGVELHDIAETRLGGQYAETAETMDKASKKPPVISSEVTPEQMTRSEITPDETTPVGSADVSSPFQNADDTEFADAASDNATSDNAAPDNPKGDQSPSSSDETSS